MTVSSHSLSGLRPAMSIGSVMFSIAVSVGSRLKAWKMKPTASRRSRVSRLSSRRRDVGVADEDGAAGGVVEPGEAVHQGRLAGAGRPHDGGELAAREVDGDGVERDDLGVARAVDLGQVDGAARRAAVGLGQWRCSSRLTPCAGGCRAHRRTEADRFPRTFRVQWG